MKKTKVAILVRVSSNSDRQDYKRQLRDLRPVCEKKGWVIVKEITAKISATKTETTSRQDIKELIQLADSGKINKVAVTEITRIGRRAKEVRRLIDYLDSKGVSVYIHSMNLDTDAQDSQQRMMTQITLTILSEFAQSETERLSERIKSGLRNARAKGKKIGRQKGSTEDFGKKLKKRKIYRETAKLLKGGWSVRKTAKFGKLSPSTVAKISKHIKQNPDWDK